MENKIIDLLIVVGHIGEQLAILSEEFNKLFDALADENFIKLLEKGENK